MLIHSINLRQFSNDIPFNKKRKINILLSFSSKRQFKEEIVLLEKVKKYFIVNKIFFNFSDCLEFEDISYILNQTDYHKNVILNSNYNILDKFLDYYYDLFNVYIISRNPLTSSLDLEHFNTLTNTNNCSLCLDLQNTDKEMIENKILFSLSRFKFILWVRTQKTPLELNSLMTEFNYLSNLHNDFKNDMIICCKSSSDIEIAQNFYNVI